MEIEVGRDINKIEKALDLVRKAMDIYHTMTEEEQKTFFIEFDKLAAEENKE